MDKKSVSELMRLKELCDKGIITQDEFESKKALLLQGQKPVVDKRRPERASHSLKKKSPWIKWGIPTITCIVLLAALFFGWKYYEKSKADNMSETIETTDSVPETDSNSPWYVGFWKASDGSVIWIGRNDWSYECFFEYYQDYSVNDAYIGRVKGYDIDEKTYNNSGNEIKGDLHMYTRDHSSFEHDEYILQEERSRIISQKHYDNRIFTKLSSPSKELIAMKDACITYKRAREKAEASEKAEVAARRVRYDSWLVGEWNLSYDVLGGGTMEILENGTILLNKTAGVLEFREGWDDHFIYGDYIYRVDDDMLCFKIDRMRHKLNFAPTFPQ